MAESSKPIPEAVQIVGRLSAEGDVEIPDYPDKEAIDDDQRRSEEPVGEVQQSIDELFGLRMTEGVSVSGGGGNGAGGQNKKPPEGLIANVVRAAVSAPFYPLKFVQVLIQLGYEPSPAEQRYSFLFRQYLYYYPGIFGYAKTIILQHGWRALYRGVGGSMFAEIVHLSANGVIRPTVNHFISKLPLDTVVPDEGGNEPDTVPENIETVRGILVLALRTFLSNTITSVAVEMIVHPFHVISIRMIAQHVGGESFYNSVWSSMKEIYGQEGLSGFYAGIVPALLGHLTRCVMYSSMWILFELAALHTPYNWAKMVIRVLVGMPLLNYLPRSYSYPFTLMSNVMAVNQSRLAVGCPPHVPLFDNWRDCYGHLKATGTLYRGSVVIFPRFVPRSRE